MDCDLAAPVALSRLHFPVSTLGPGARAGIWFQGCSLHCPGCVSRDTWPPGTELVPVGSVLHWVEALAARGVTGVTLSGGEPFDQAEALAALVGGLRRSPALADIDILAYSGYPLARLRRRHGAVLELVDALISGPYVASRPTARAWRGSSNQPLSLFSERARARFDAADPAPSLQVSADGSQLWITGIPRPGDLDRLGTMLAGLGVDLQEVSWTA